MIGIGSVEPITRIKSANVAGMTELGWTAMMMWCTLVNSVYCYVTATRFIQNYQVK